HTLPRSKAGWLWLARSRRIRWVKRINVPTDINAVDVVVSSVCSLLCNLIDPQLFNVEHSKPLEVLVGHPLVEVWARPVTAWPYQSIVLALKATKLHYPAYVGTVVVLETTEPLGCAVGMGVNVDHAYVLVFLCECADVC